MGFLRYFKLNRAPNSGRNINIPDVFKPREKCSVKIYLQKTCLRLRSKCDKDVNSFCAEICWIVHVQWHDLRKHRRHHHLSRRLSSWSSFARNSKFRFRTFGSFHRRIFPGVVFFLDGDLRKFGSVNQSWPSPDWVKIIRIYLLSTRVSFSHATKRTL